MSFTTHSPGIVPVAASRLLDRFGYYGMRSLLVLYLVEKLLFTKGEASNVYGIFTAIISILPIFGGLLSDFAMGARLASIVGSGLQALGCFLLCVPHQAGALAGLGFIALGVGLYNPNSMAQLGILYKARPALTDSAMMIIYAVVNIGAILGPVIIGLAERDNVYAAGFFIAGLSHSSSLFILFKSGWLKELTFTANRNLPAPVPASINSAASIVLLICLLLLIPLYWIFFNRADYLLFQLTESSTHYLGLPSSAYSLLNPMIVLFLSILLAIVWYFIRISSVLKISSGFFIFTLLCLSLITILARVSGSPTVMFVFSATLLQAASEVLVAPIAVSCLCQLVPAKFISTFIGLYLFLSYALSYGSNTLMKLLDVFSPSASLWIIAAITFIIGTLFLGFYLVMKKNNGEHSPISI